MKKAILAAIAAAALSASALSTSAMAADVGVPYTKAPSFAPAFSWTGLYVGLNGGYGWGSPGDALFTGFDLAGPFLGAQAGYNWQNGNFVLGVELDAHWANISESVGVPGIATVESDIDFFGSARLRAGFAVQQALFYLTGGVAIAHNEITLSAPIILVPTLSDSQTHVGWTVGAGLEYAFAPAWSAKVEYRYTNYGSETYFGNVLPTGDVDVSTIHFGLNYRFY